DLRVPAVPPELKCPGEPVNTNGIDVLHHSAVAHQLDPLRVHRAACSKNGFLTAFSCPMRRAADHLAEDQPLRIQHRVPFLRVPRFVPELYPLEIIPKPGDEHIEKVGVLLWI